MRALGGQEGFSDYKRSKLKVKRCMEESLSPAQASTSCLRLSNLELTQDSPSAYPMIFSVVVKCRKIDCFESSG